MKKFRKFLRIPVGICLLCVLFFVMVRLEVILETDGQVLTEEEIGELSEYRENPFEAVIVLGASVLRDGTPSPVLKARLDRTVEVYESGAARSIFVTGDHRVGEYDEVDRMCDYLIGQGIPREALWYDYEGVSTFDQMSRAAETFDIRHAIVVTQEYHIYRALYVGEKCGMEVLGVPAKKSRPGDLRTGAQAVLRNLREWPACVKDVFNCIMKEAGK